MFIGFAPEVSHRLALVDEGRILEVASPEELFTRPSLERTKLFLSKIL
jgi:ABC-type polar amino acid transport system ATPase subunit